MTRVNGAIKMNFTLLKGRLDLTIKRPSYQPTGTHPSTRYVLVWRLINKSGSLPSTQLRPALCIHWSLMKTTATPHWVVIRGNRWLVQKPLCSSTVTKRDSISSVLAVPVQEQESVSLVTTKMTAILVIPESGLVQVEDLMTLTHVEM